MVFSALQLPIRHGVLLEITFASFPGQQKPLRVLPRDLLQSSHQHYFALMEKRLSVYFNQIVFLFFIRNFTVEVCGYVFQAAFNQFSFGARGMRGWGKVLHV